MLYRKFVPFLKKITFAVVIAGVVLFIGRIYQAEKGGGLHRWHTWSANELSAEEVDQVSFSGYLVREEAIFRDLKTSVTDKLSTGDTLTINRFDAQSPVSPGHFKPDWNRSFVLMPEGPVRGAVVLLHGLTDSPYSVRYLAEDYRQKGFVAVVPRLPGHGTAPGALTAVGREEWMAVTRLAVREATRLAGVSVPLHMVGYSNGAALAMKYTLDSLKESTLRKPQQLVLLSPMIGVTAYARFAGLAGWPSVFPAFAKTAWLNVLPEFNPYKYNSFPVKAARESWLLTQALQQQILQQSRSGKLDGFPPVLTFQSIIDSTVSTRAVIDSLYRYLPANGSELVLFDINHAASLRTLFRPVFPAIDTLLPPVPRRYGTTVITNVTAESDETVARKVHPGEVKEWVQPLHLSWPQGMYSLSHLAIPFPVSDSLYGIAPAEKARYGISLGTLAPRGESAALVVSLDTLMRATSNPFFDYMMARINGTIICSQQTDFLQCITA